MHAPCVGTLIRLVTPSQLMMPYFCPDVFFLPDGSGVAIGFVILVLSHVSGFCEILH